MAQRVEQVEVLQRIGADPGLGALQRLGLGIGRDQLGRDLGGEDRAEVGEPVVSECEVGGDREGGRAERLGGDEERDRLGEALDATRDKPGDFVKALVTLR